MYDKAEEADGARRPAADGGRAANNIAAVLGEQARRFPDRPAIVDTHDGHDRSCSFAELDHMSARAAALLHRLGLRAGDTVLVFQPMSLELYQVLAALFRLGLVAMFVDPAAGRRSLERSCALHAPKGLIASSKAHLLRLISPALRRIPVKVRIGSWVPKTVDWDDGRALRPRREIAPVTPDAPALITFTSGSTGEPKAVVRSHGLLLAQHRAVDDALGLQAGDIDLATLPVVVLANLASGVTSLLPGKGDGQRGTPDGEALAARINRHRPNTTAARPGVLDTLARYCLKRDLVLSGLRRIVVGGAPVRPDLLETLRRLAPRAEIIALYGATEAEPIAKVSLDEIASEDMARMHQGGGLLTGLPVRDIRVRILPERWGRPIGPFTPDAFAAEILPHGRRGEIVVSGAHVLTRYLDGHRERTTTFTVGTTNWHRTGDAGYFDNKGRLWFLGRCAEPRSRMNTMPQVPPTD